MKLQKVKLYVLRAIFTRAFRNRYCRNNFYTIP